MTSRILRLKALIQHTGLSRSAIYDRMDEKSPRHDPSFPRSFQLGGQAVGWYETEVDTWLAHCANPTKADKILPRQKTANQSISSADQSHTNQPSLQSKDSQDSPQTLADMVIKGGQINSIMERYLSMRTWTPAMGALLINGVIPEDRCMSIPKNAIGLDNTELPERHPRLIAAQKLLDLFHDYEEGDVQSTEIRPIDFYIWCDESSIDTVWSRHFGAVGQIKKCDTDMNAAAFALLTRR
jgi:prophage regulatory protein